MSLFSTLLGCGQDLAWSTLQQQIERSYPTVSHITTDSLAQWLDGPTPAPLLLDIREQEEFAVSHLPGAIHVPPDDTTLTSLEGYAKDQPVVAYCSVGYRSSAMARHLQDAGFTTVYNLKGSIFQWANEGRTVVRGDSAVTSVHPYSPFWGQLLDDSLRSELPDQ